MTFSLLPERKVFRDTIHSYIHVEHTLIWQLINTPEMQRMKRIHQLGGTYQVFPTAEHSRFSHALGAYEIARRLLSEVPSIHEALNDVDGMTLLCAALLHDIGHGPFSHAFEMIHPIRHEEYSVAILLGPSRVHEVLEHAHEGLAQAVASVLKKEHPLPLLNQLVSSQIDADRMDYLLRDAYFTGTPYGAFDVSRVLRLALVHQGRLVFKESGMAAVENFMMGRYHMYRQVYFHPASMSYEVMIAKWFQRFSDLVEQHYPFQSSYPQVLPFVGRHQVTIPEYLAMDDMTLLFSIRMSGEEADSILQDLSDRILNRRLFRHQRVDREEDIQALQAKVALEHPLAYYFYVDRPTQTVYKKYGRNDQDAVYLMTPNYKVEELSKMSAVVRALKNDRLAADDETLVFYP